MNENKNLSLEETFSLAIQNHQENNLDIAIELYNKILKSDPNNILIHYNLGLALYNIGELQKAINCYKKVIEIDPNYLSAHLNMGIAKGIVIAQKKHLIVIIY